MCIINTIVFFLKKSFLKGKLFKYILGKSGFV